MGKAMHFHERFASDTIRAHAITQLVRVFTMAGVSNITHGGGGGQPFTLRAFPIIITSLIVFFVIRGCVACGGVCVWECMDLLIT